MSASDGIQGSESAELLSEGAIVKRKSCVLRSGCTYDPRDIVDPAAGDAAWPPASGRISHVLFRHPFVFDEPFPSPPSVVVGFERVEVAGAGFIEVSAEDVTSDGFTIVVEHDEGAIVGRARIGILAAVQLEEAFFSNMGQMLAELDDSFRS